MADDIAVAAARGLRAQRRAAASAASAAPAADDGRADDGVTTAADSDRRFLAPDGGSHANAFAADARPRGANGDPFVSNH